jgi:hypothetical protein
MGLLINLGTNLEEWGVMKFRGNGNRQSISKAGVVSRVNWNDSYYQAGLFPGLSVLLKVIHWGGIVRVSSHSNGVNNLKHSKFGVITLLLFGMVIALTGIVYAD